jgi:hypothetical protein
VTQPLDQRASCEAMGDLDENLGEFWMENPWEPSEHNLSAYERNRVLLNDGAGGFVDVSHLTHTDLDSDSRGIVIADLNGDAQPEIIVRSSGGGPIRIFENRLPRTNRLTLSLRGEQAGADGDPNVPRSSSQGLGARVRIETQTGTITRQLYPVQSFLGQHPARIDVGVGEASEVSRLSIQWPSGRTQDFENVPANSHLTIYEGQSELKQAR